MGYSVFRIDDVANRRGEDFLNRIVSAFSCVKNREVDEFLEVTAMHTTRSTHRRRVARLRTVQILHGLMALGQRASCPLKSTTTKPLTT